MKIETEQKEKILQLGDHLVKGYNICKEEFDTDIKIISELKRISPEFGNISPGAFSQLLHLKKPSKLKFGRGPKLKNIVKAMDALVKDMSHQEWNSTANNYIKGKSSNETNKYNNKKLNDLSGFWKGYSWNRSKSESSQEHHVNIFRMEITDCNTIHCNTTDSEFNGKMTLISEERMLIDIASKPSASRRIYLIGKIGTLEDLHKISTINLAYTDSGNNEIKCGLAVIIKINEKEYKEIIAGISTKDKSEIDETSFNFITGTYILDKSGKPLVGTQHVAPILSH